jgi:hypothetical protein
MRDSNHVRKVLFRGDDRKEKASVLLSDEVNLISTRIQSVPRDHGTGKLTIHLAKKMLEVWIEGCDIATDDGEGGPLCEFRGFAQRTSVDPQDGLRGLVCPVPPLRAHLPSVTKTFFEEQDD